MKFSKYEGIGNDFIVVDRPEIDAILARRLCDRRLGIGADGVLVVEPGEAALFRMTVWNADGSVAEMCGNGLRCVGRHLQRTVEDLPERFTVETGAGPLWVSVDDDAVTAQIGVVRDHGNRVIEVDQYTFEGQLLSTGNPHFVLFEPVDDAIMSTYGPILERHSTFSDGANISFASRLGPTELKLTVWERGCGFTQACGTGACATTVAGWLGGYLEPDQPITVHLPGGSLEISGDASNVIMRGPATHVFDGHWAGA